MGGHPERGEGHLPGAHAEGADLPHRDLARMVVRLLGGKVVGALVGGGGTCLGAAAGQRTVVGRRRGAGGRRRDLSGSADRADQADGGD